MSKFVESLSDSDLRDFRIKLTEEFRECVDSNHARLALDRLLVVDAEYIERERVSGKKRLNVVDNGTDL